MKKRGRPSLTIRSWVTVTFWIAEPTLVCRSTACTVARQVVRLSGKVTQAIATPLLSVFTDGNQAAVSRKSLRTRGSVLSGPPEYSSGNEHAVSTWLLRLL